MHRILVARRRNLSLQCLNTLDMFCFVFFHVFCLMCLMFVVGFSKSRVGLCARVQLCSRILKITPCILLSPESPATHGTEVLYLCSSILPFSFA